MTQRADDPGKGPKNERSNVSSCNGPGSTKICEPPTDLREEVDALRKGVMALRCEESLDGPNALFTREEAAKWPGISILKPGGIADEGEIQRARIRGRVLCSLETLDANIRRYAGEGRQYVR